MAAAPLPSSALLGSSETEIINWRQITADICTPIWRRELPRNVTRYVNKLLKYPGIVRRIDGLTLKITMEGHYANKKITYTLKEKMKVSNDHPYFREGTYITLSDVFPGLGAKAFTRDLKARLENNLVRQTDGQASFHIHISSLAPAGEIALFRQSRNASFLMLEYGGPTDEIISPSAFEEVSGKTISEKMKLTGYALQRGDVAYISRRTPCRSAQSTTGAPQPRLHIDAYFGYGE